MMRCPQAVFDGSNKTKQDLLQKGFFQQPAGLFINLRLAAYADMP